MARLYATAAVLVTGLAAFGWLPPAASALEPPGLEGFVRQNDERGPALAGVQILAAGANPGASDSTGRYFLQFPRKRPGSAVLLQVAKAGFEVVNWPHLQLNLPEHPALQPLHIFLCAAPACEEIRTRFFLAASLEGMEAESARRLRALEAQGKADAAAMEKLRAELELARGGAEQAARALARIDPSEVSKTNREALRLLLSGQPSEALKILKKDRLREEARAIRKNADERYRVVVWGFELRAAARLQQLDPRGAEAELRDAVEVVPESAYGWLALGNHLAAQDRHGEAAALFEKGLERARSAGDDWAVGALANSLGNALGSFGQYARARQSLNEALDLYTAAADGEERPADLAMVLSNLGVLDAEEQRFAESRRHFEKALEICRDLALSQPETFLPLMAGMLRNLGHLDNRENRVPEAHARLVQALNILQHLSAEDSRFAPDLADSLDSLGVFAAANRQFAAALDYHLQALDLRRPLAEVNPSGQSDDLAVTLNNLGLAHLQLGQLDAAAAALEEAEEICADQLQQGRVGAEADLAAIKVNLARVYGDARRLPEALGRLRVAVESYGRFTAQNPDVYLSYEAGALNNLGSLLRDSGEVAEAIAAFEASRDRYLRLEQRAPHVFAPDVAMTLMNLAALYDRTRRSAEALEAGRQAEDRLRQAVAANPSRFGASLAQALHNLGVVELGRADNPAARAHLEEAVLLLRALAAEDPPSGATRRQLASTIFYLGLLESFEGKVEAARRAFDEVEVLAGKLEAERPGSASDLLEGARGERSELPAGTESKP